MSTTGPEPWANTPGFSVGRYRLLAKIGEGGMGVVHLAESPDGGRVALKVLRPHIIGDDEARERLAREVASLRRVTSPRIAEVVDADPWGETPYVATRYVPGLSLHDHVREEGPLHGDDLRWFAAGLIEAIIAVHSVGVLHRDIKPSNVLLEGRSPVLIDFGLARLAEDPRLTVTGWLLGTPGYLAPEILYGDDASTASDVHSWAATLVFAASGRPPFGRGPAMAIMDRVRRGEHDLTAVPSDLLPLVKRCLAPNPEDRPETLAILATLRASGPSAAGPLGQAVDEQTMPISMMSTGADEDATDVLGADPPDGDPDRTPTVAQPVEGMRPDRTRPLTVQAPQAAAAMQPARSPYVEPPPPQGLPYHPGSPQQWQQLPGGLARFQRGCLLLGLFALVAVGFAMAPYLSLAVLTLTTLAVRTVSWTAESARERRYRRGGDRWYDGLLAVVTSPWYLLVATGGTLMLLAWAVIVAVVVGLAYVLFSLPLVPWLLLMGAVIAVSLWWGPGSLRLRVPARRLVVRGTREANLGWACAGCLAVVVAVCGYLLVANGVSWNPQPGPPWRPSTLLGELVQRV